jgi:hypothetical protein
MFVDGRADDDDQVVAVGDDPRLRGQRQCLAQDTFQDRLGPLLEKRHVPPGNGGHRLFVAIVADHPVTRVGQE